MAVTLTTQLPAHAFATEIRRLDFKAEANTSHTIALTLAGTEVISTTLTADAAGAMTLADTGWLLSVIALQIMEHYDEFDQQLSIKADGAEVGTITLWPCRQALYLSGEDFVQRSFLTMAGGGCKEVPYDADEWLYWYPATTDPSPMRATYTAVYMEAQTGAVRRLSNYGSVEPSYGAVYSVDASPRAVLGPDDPTADPQAAMQLLYYEVSVGQRTMRYRLTPTDRNAAPVTRLGFRNVFGLDDTLYLSGEVAETLKPTYTQIIADGMALNANIEAQAEYKATTGPLTATDVALLKDLATSRSTWHGEAGITITAAELKDTNAYATAPTATITWRESQSGLSVLTPLPQRTFNMTFDATFL